MLYASSVYSNIKSRQENFNTCFSSSNYFLNLNNSFLNDVVKNVAAGDIC